METLLSKHILGAVQLYTREATILASHWSKKYQNLPS